MVLSVRAMNLFTSMMLLPLFMEHGDLLHLNANHDLIDFVKAAGWKRLSIVSAEQSNLMKMIRPVEIFKELQVVFAPHGKFDKRFPTLFLLTQSNPDQFWDSVACVKPNQCLGFMDHSTWPKFKQHMETLKKSRAFYSLVIGPTGLSKYRSQTFRDQIKLVLNPITLARADKGIILKHDYDMEGATLTSISKDWSPFNRFFNCKHEGWKDCQQEGIIGSMSNILAKQFNFTIVANKEPNDNWGKQVLLGKTSLANWTEGQPFPNGVFGYLEHQRADVTLMSFRHFLERATFFDFSIPICSATRKIVFNLNRNTTMDFTMFFRPFAELSWSFVALATTFFVILVFIFNKLDSKFDKRLSYQIMMLNIWLMFVVLNAYYGGALTMFFSTAPSIPFDNLHDVIRLHPNWKLFIAEDDWTYLLSQAVSEEVLDRVMNSEQYQVHDFETAMQKIMSEPGAYFCPTDIRLNHFLSQHPLPKSR